MFTRLPLDIVHVNNTPHVNSVNLGADRCIACCQIVMDLFLFNITELRANEDFSAYWCKFTNILAHNINVTDRNATVYNQLLEMIVVLFRLLKPAPHSTSHAHEIADHEEGSSFFFLTIFTFYLYDQNEEVIDGLNFMSFYFFCFCINSF